MGILVSIQIQFGKTYLIGIIEQLPEIVLDTSLLAFCVRWRSWVAAERRKYQVSSGDPLERKQLDHLGKVLCTIDSWHCHVECSDGRQKKVHIKKLYPKGGRTKTWPDMIDFDCRALGQSENHPFMLLHLRLLGTFQLDIPLFTLTWPAKHSPNQGWESTHRLHLYPLSCVFYSPLHRALGRRNLDFTSHPNDDGEPWEPFSESRPNSLAGVVFRNRILNSGHSFNYWPCRMTT